MQGKNEVPELHVEGKDDRHTIAALLNRHGVEMQEGKRPIEIVEAENVDRLLAKMPEAVAAATNRPVGFVVDIDFPIVQRWTQVRDRLTEAKVDAPIHCPAEGFIGQRSDYPSQAKVGVWLMPDCSSDGGKLEHLLETLVPAKDETWPHARKSTDKAKRIGAAFRDVDQDKAYIHCWLAWQKDPGTPFGTAINAKFFGHDSPQALAFLRWLKNLYDLAQLTGV